MALSSSGLLPNSLVMPAQWQLAVGDQRQSMGQYELPYEPLGRLHSPDWQSWITGACVLRAQEQEREQAPVVVNGGPAVTVLVL